MQTRQKNVATLHLTRERPVVFYDGSCPLCSREINHYRRLDQANRIQWLDIAEGPGTTTPFGLPWEQAMQRMHLLEVNGRFVSGAYAFAAMWRQLPYYRFLAMLVSFPGLLNLLDRVYNVFARLRWRSQCNDTCSRN